VFRHDIASPNAQLPTVLRSEDLFSSAVAGSKKRTRNVKPDMSISIPDKKRWRVVLIVGAALLLYMLGGNLLRNTVGSEGTATPFTPASERRPFTPLQGTTIPAGAPWRLDSLRGKIVLLNYAATWCAPCRRETPDLVAAAKQLRDRPFEIVGVMMDEGKKISVDSVVGQYADQYNISYPLIRPNDDPLLRFSGIGLPTSVLLDRQGRQVRTYVGPVSLSTLTADVERVSQEPNPPN
jgi:thiol-disulfide isomerase/thioredoxin